MTRLAHDWRLAPVAATAWAAAWVGTSGALPGWLGLVALWAGLAAVVAWRRARILLAVLLVTGVVVGALAAARSALLHGSLPAQLASEGAAAEVVVSLRGEAAVQRRAQRPPFAVARASLHHVSARGLSSQPGHPVVLMASGEAAEALASLRPGARVVVRGLLAPADADSPEALVIRVRDIGAEVAGPGPLDTLVNGLRAGLRQASAHSPPAQAALLPSLVVGDTAGITDEMSEEFRATSLSHLLAVSGVNNNPSMGRTTSF